MFYTINLQFREPESILPKFIVDHFNKTGFNNIPLPRVKQTTKIGSVIHHQLVYSDDPSLDQWVPLANYTDLGDTEDISCNTSKDKDKRTHR